MEFEQVLNLKFTTSLKKNHEFRRLYSKGKSAASQYVVIYCRRNNSTENRLGITVSKKVGGAVQRNRVRRRLKEIYRLNEAKLAVGYDVVIVARVKCLDVEYQKLESSTFFLFKKLGILLTPQKGTKDEIKRPHNANTRIARPHKPIAITEAFTK